MNKVQEEVWFDEIIRTGILKVYLQLSANANANVQFEATGEKRGKVSYWFPAGKGGKGRERAGKLAQRHVKIDVGRVSMTEKTIILI